MPAVPGPVISSVVEAAIQAPSGDNCQPWRFQWDGECLRIFFLAERAESLYDILSMSSWISLGTVITNLKLAALKLGFETTLELFPTDDGPGVVARALFQAGPAVTADPLVEAIPLRCVNRHPYRNEPIPPEIRKDMAALTAAIPGMRLSWTDADPAKKQIARLAAQNDRILLENRELHDSVYGWIRWTRAEAERRRDGMPGDTLGLSRFELPGMRLLGSWPCARLAAALGITRGLPLRATRLYRSSAAIALLSVRGDRPEDFVRGGETLGRIWLTATQHGVAFQPITGITFLLLRMRLAGGERLAARHRALLSRIGEEFRQVYPEAAGDSPIMLFRLGLAPPPAGRTPRLPLEQVLEVGPRAR